MYTSFFIAKNNMKKKKSDVIVVILLIMLATMLLYVSKSVLGNGSKVVKNAAEACNSADYTYFTSEAGSLIASEVWDNLEQVDYYEISEVLYLPAVKYYGSDTDEKEFVFILSDLEEERTINKKNYSESISKGENSIILPYSLSISEGYKLGDKFYMEISGEKYEFEIMAFTEDPLFATTLNISTYRCYISEDYIEKIIAKGEGLKDLQYRECRVMLKEGMDTDVYFEELYEKTLGRDKDIMFGFSFEAMSGGVMMMPGICMGAILAFSVVLVAIAVIVMRFSVKNFIEDNLKNIGILQACGYTSVQLRMATLMETGLIGVIGCILGLILSALGEDIVGNILASMIGLRYNVGFDTVSAVFAFVVVMVVVLLIAYVSSRAYKTVNVLDALRGGIHTHNFKKNVIALHKSKLPVNIAVGAKNIFGAKFRNAGILLIVAILGFASCFGFALYENFAVNKDFMLKLVGVELGTGITTGTDVEEMGKVIESWEPVEKVGYCGAIEVNVSSGGKSKSITSDVWKDTDKLENIMLVEGSFPKYDNEIVISTVIRDYFEVGVGDVIYLQGDTGNLPYMVSGIHQCISNSGERIMLNYDGAAKLNKDGTVRTIQLYVYAKDGYGYSDIAELMEEHYPGIQMAESAEVAEGSTAIVGLAMRLICVLFVGITVVVVLLVVFLLIRSKVISDKKNNGIYKAIGYTTKNLMLQTTMSNLPVIFAGAVVGAIASIFGVSPLTKLCLAFCGIEKCEMTIPPVYLVGTVIGITVVAFVVSMAVSSRIRKVEPVKMLTEE